MDEFLRCRGGFDPARFGFHGIANREVEHGSKFCQQLFSRKGLGNKFLALLKELCTQIVANVAAHKDMRHIAVEFQYLPHHFYAAHFRHDDVRQYQIKWAVLLKKFKTL